MSEVFERSIEDWYSKSRTARLEYLDLAEEPKVCNRQLAHNLSVVFDRISLLSKVTLKNFKLILERLSVLEPEIEKDSIKNKNIQKPLSGQQLEALVTKLTAQPKEIEGRTISLATELRKEVSQLKLMIAKVEKLL
uniref:ORF1 n=1 Tax=Piper yellow mottle virus TaxID=262957 RepID=A0A076U5L4_9VIRU|nr:ORF1 [Piper yellow mottle virus]